MDADSLSSTLVLAVSLAMYAYLTLAVEVFGAAARPNHQAPVQPGLTRPLWFLRLATVLASSAGLLGLLHSIESATVVITALSFLMLLLLLWLVQAVCALSARRWPWTTRWIVSPVSTLLDRVTRLPEADMSAQSAEEANTAEGPPVPDDEGFFTEEQRAVLDERERRMIRSILSLEEDVVREIMVPRVDVIAVDRETPVIEAVKLMLSSGHSRLPVYEETIDRIVGIVHARDLLRFMGQDRAYPPLKETMRPPFFIPESKTLDKLLQEFQSRRLHMAIVVDEYGGTEGIVTLEDLLEEIVGEIEDEFSQEEPEITLSDRGRALVDARVSLDDLNELLGTRLEMEGVDTVGGYVYGSLGRMPRIGDSVQVDDVRIEVVAAIGRRLRKLQITRPPDSGEERKS